MFLMKRALHFNTTLNSGDIQKFNCFWVPSYDLFACARKVAFPGNDEICTSFITKHKRRMFQGCILYE